MQQEYQIKYLRAAMRDLESIAGVPKGRLPRLCMRQQGH